MHVHNETKRTPTAVSESCAGAAAVLVLTPRGVHGDLLDGLAASPHPLVPLLVGSTDDELGARPWILARRLRKQGVQRLSAPRCVLKQAYGSAAALRRGFNSDRAVVGDDVMALRRGGTVRERHAPRVLDLLRDAHVPDTD